MTPVSESRINDTTRRAVIASANDDARQIGEVWHRLDCPCVDCIFARKDHSDRIAAFTDTQVEPIYDTQRVIEEYNLDSWGAHDWWDCKCQPCRTTRKATADLSTFLSFAVHTEALTTEPQPPLPALLSTDDGATLFYEGRYNILCGSPGEGKSWVSLFCTIQAIRQGSRVAIWDFEDRAVTTATRLQALGVSDVLGSVDLIYVTPTLADDPTAKSALIKWLKGGSRAGLVVIDAAESSGAPSDGGDVNPWLREFVDPFKDADLGILVVDHVAKQRIDRPRGPIGSTRKLAAPTGATLLCTGAPWTTKESGTIKLRNDKDRPGQLPARMGKCVATINGTWVNGILTYTIDPPDNDETDGDLTDQLLIALAAHGEDVRTKESVRKLIKGKAIEKDAALSDLLAMGLVEIRKEGRTNVYHVTEEGHKEVGS